MLNRLNFSFRSFRFFVAMTMMVGGVAALGVAQETTSQPAIEEIESPLSLETRRVQGTDHEVLYGHYKVYENRETRTGRKLELTIIIIPALSETPKPDPIFFLHGGPGAPATPMFRGHLDSPMRNDRDLVYVDQRGTGGSHRLDCKFGTDDHDLQSYLDPLFDAEIFRDCLETLKNQADLTQYSTCIAMDDLNEIREALGYEKINLIGGSYGTRASLIYMRRHEETVRTATLLGVAPVAFRNPLYHAWGAQRALEMMFEECDNDPECSKRIPDLEMEFNAVLARLDEGPVETTVTHPKSGQRVSIQLTRESFTGTMRHKMYYLGTNRDLPWLIHRAFEGDYEPFAQSALQSSTSLRNLIAIGMLLSVTCAEDLDRISYDDIAKETANTFTGPGRVTRQKKICDFWPRSDLPDNYGEPVNVDTHTLVISGIIDPVTPPRWGEETVRHLKNGRHVIAPCAHDYGSGCVWGTIQRFISEGTAEDLDTSCVEKMTLPPFRFPEN